MKNGRPQCKDIPEQPIMELLRKNPTRYFCVFSGYDNSIIPAFPVHCRDDKLVRAKLRNMIKRGLFHGCACGCRGDLKINYHN